ncbi:MAG: hypothetical protein M9887_10180 [Chitinophagales bacterium]|nr:hypothetical protein [Chitinophagales bacterium]
MKKTGVFIMLSIFVMGLSACRKGPEDPLLSFKTRKNRLSNNWVAYKYKVNGVDILNEEQSGTKNIPNCGVQNIDTLINRSIKMNFSKNGNYSDEYVTKTKISARTANNDDICAQYNFDDSTKAITNGYGNWSFSGGTGGTSKREQLLIFQEETREGLLWDIVRLASTDLKLSRKYIVKGESTFTTEEISFNIAK